MTITRTVYLRCMLYPLAALLAGPLCATTALRLDLDQLTDRSERMTRAKITRVESRWDAARKGIWTHHTLDCTEALKGPLTREIEFVTRGGTVGNIGQHVAGAGTFSVGDECVFCLCANDRKQLELTGMVQGALKLVVENGALRARNSLAGLKIVDRETLKPVQTQALDLTFSALRDHVHARLRAQKALLPAQVIPGEAARLAAATRAALVGMKREDE